MVNDHHFNCLHTLHQIKGDCISMHQLCCMKKVANSVCKMQIFCLKMEEFLLFLTCCFKLTTNHERKFASTCKMCFPNTCKTVLCSGNQFPVKIHIFLFFNFVHFFMELPLCTLNTLTYTTLYTPYTYMHADKT